MSDGEYLPTKTIVLPENSGSEPDYKRIMEMLSTQGYVTPGSTNLKFLKRLRNSPSALAMLLEGTGVYGSILDVLEDMKKQLAAKDAEFAVYHEGLKKQVAELEQQHAKDQETIKRLREALKRLIPAAEFADLEQSPPGYYEHVINEAKAMIGIIKGFILSDDRIAMIKDNTKPEAAEKKGRDL